MNNIDNSKYVMISTEYKKIDKILGQLEDQSLKIRKLLIDIDLYIYTKLNDLTIIKPNNLLDYKDPNFNIKLKQLKIKQENDDLALALQKME